MVTALVQLRKALVVVAASAARHGHQHCVRACTRAPARTLQRRLPTGPTGLFSAKGMAPAAPLVASETPRWRAKDSAGTGWQNKLVLSASLFGWLGSKSSEEGNGEGSSDASQHTEAKDDASAPSPTSSAASQTTPAGDDVGEMSPALAQLIVNARFCVNREEYDMAAQHLEQAFKLMAEEKRPLSEVGAVSSLAGNVYLEINQPDKAVACFSKTLAALLSENHGEATIPAVMVSLKIASLKGHMGLADEAVAGFEWTAAAAARVVAQSKTEPAATEARFTLGLVCETFADFEYRSKAYKEAIVLYQRALETASSLGTDDASIGHVKARLGYAIAVCQWELGHAERALEMCEYALKHCERVSCSHLQTLKRFLTILQQ